MPGRKAGALKTGPINSDFRRVKAERLALAFRSASVCAFAGMELKEFRTSLRFRGQESAARERSSTSGHSTGTFQMSRAYSLMTRSEENQAMLAVLRMLMRVQADAERHSWSIRRCVA